MEIYHVASRWIYYLRGRIQSEDTEKGLNLLTNALFPGGVIVALTKVHRFHQNSLIKRNDGLVMAGCIQPLCSKGNIRLLMFS